MLSIVFGLFACGSGGSSEPAQNQPAVVATAEPAELAEPTQVPLEPTETFVDQPTEELASDSSESKSEATPTEESTSEMPAPENSVFVKTVSGYRDDLGYLHVVGLVTNNTDQPVNNLSDAMRSDREQFKRFFHGMLDEGVYIAPSQFEAGYISTAHTSRHIEKTIQAAGRVMRSM